METVSKKACKWAKHMGLLGFGLCTLCCTLPIVGILGGTGLLTFISLYAEKAALALLIISAGLFALWLYKKRQAPLTCSVNCSCKTDNDEPDSIQPNT